MKGSKPLRKVVSQVFRGALVVLCTALIALGGPGWAQQQTGQPETAPKIPNDQLDSLVAPIALYPDPLLAQVLAASTYPLEIVQLQQFLSRNKDLKGQALVDAVAKQNWDPTVQALAEFPDVVKRLADDIQWTTDLGNAFLAQEADVMAAVQRMRKKAQANGALKSDDKMVVETKAVEGNDAIVVQQANPQVVYVPSYNPTAVYGAPAYPYPPVYYPTGGLLLSFGVGVAMGAAWGGWCCNAGWGGGGNNVTINNNNTFVSNSNRANVNGGNRQSASGGNRTGGSGKWQHNPQHRGGAPYGDRATADRFGGAARGEGRPGQGGRQQPGGGNRPGGGAGAGNRPGGGAGAGNRPGGGAGAGNRPGGGGGAANRPSAGTGVGNRPSAGTGAGNRPSAGTGVGNRPSGSGADGIGGRDLSRGGGSGRDSFGGGRGGYNGRDAGASSSRGSSSMGGRGGGGRSGGGGASRPSGGGGGRRR